ncbi:MAG TPA: M56 family metallopeptidase [Gemmatimonadaceae bacterium]|nr:M56 family metallopeptidase [Gemmatimonadaceae bacterium]
MSIPETLASMDSFISLATLVVAKTTILLALAGIACLALRRRSAALRHLAWALAVGGVVVLPIMVALMPALPVLPAPPAPAAPTVGAPASLPEETDHAVRDIDADHAAPPATQSVVTTPTRTIDPTRLFAGIWIAGVILLLARFGIGVARVTAMVRRAVPVSDPGWLSVAQRHADARMLVDLRVSDEVDMPFASGLVSPTIVLPVASKDWSAGRREAVLLHELAHLSRGDLFMNALSHLARALYWFNPLAWYATHRLRIEGERAADDAVLRRGARASDYADHLLSIASGGAVGLPTAALAMARPSAFEGRLLAILEPGVERAAPSRLRVALTSAAFLVVVFPLAAASPTARAAAMEKSAAPIPATTEMESPLPQDPPVPQPQPAPATQASNRATSAVPALIDALGDASVEVRLAAVTSLGTLEDPRAIAALGKALKEDADPRVREAAAEALGEIGDVRAVPHLLDALKGEKVARVKEEIISSLQEIDDPSAVPGIIAVIKDPSAAVRRAAVSALGDFEAQSALGAIMELVRDTDVEVRREVADALSDLESADALATLITLSRDSDAEVRANAVNGLGSLEDPRALDALVAALKDANADVRSHAADGIHNIPEIKSAPRALIDALADADAEVRQNVAHALGGIGDEAAVPALKRALGDTNVEVRRSVAEALSEIGGADAITALMGLLKDPDPDIRRTAAEALGKRR